MRPRSNLGRSDPEAFVDDLYRRLLGRPADPDGSAIFVRMLRDGVPPAEIAVSLALSDEYRQRVIAAKSPRRRDPQRYRLAVDLTGTSAFWVYDVNDDADFDRLEAVIIDDGYYEHSGVWSLEPDEDKRVMGELLASLGAHKALELGCSSGTVLAVLASHGVAAEGVEISRLAYDRAAPAIRPHIHLGDLLTLDLDDNYDLVYGLDVFEHVNPNRLGEYLRALRARLEPGGWLFANIPAFGDDEVFGEVFPIYVREWYDDIAAARPFRVLHCDDDGYPMNGHLVWAHTSWWVAQFEAVGLVRQRDVERALHERYAGHFRTEPARASFYVFRASRSEAS
jgi:SAM-dependent methyltransferase